MIHSLRKYGGRFSDTPFWIVIPEHVQAMSSFREAATNADEILTVAIPEPMQWLPYAVKPYAAALAEERLESESDIVAWLDCDTIFMAEPIDFDLCEDKAFAYRPVMHNRSGSLYDSPPNEYWQRIYSILEIEDDLFFPMFSHADQQKIRPYFQAGILVVRPERGVLRWWRDDFEKLSRDPALVELCEADRVKGVFLHQAALVGAVLHSVAPVEMVQLSDGYNYPLFFDRQYESKRAFDSIESAVTLRIVVSSQALGENWDSELAGQADKIAWLKAELAHEG